MPFFVGQGKGKGMRQVRDLESSVTIGIEEGGRQKRNPVEKGHREYRIER
jgi:hypothetical protein